MTVLDATERDTALSELSGWKEAQSGKVLKKQFRFKTFNQAFGWMTRVALAAETQNHHPDWCQSYNVVEVSLSTHSEGGVTEKDIKLAQLMNDYAA